MRGKQRHLFLMAALVWGIPGIIITAKGATAYLRLPSVAWWLPIATLAVLVAFCVMFRRVEARYSAHIASRPEPCSPWEAFPTRGWLLIGFMMGLGITLRFIEGLPLEFVASFYSGLGPMLLWSALRFLKQM